AAKRLGKNQEVARLRALGDNLRSKEKTTGTRGVGDEGGFREVDVFYATDRLRTDRENPAELYGSGRGELEYGTLRVSIPDIHVPGAIEAPSIWSLEFSENPAKHIILQSVSPLEERVFYERLQTVMQFRERKEAFVFIHGFNVRFEAAAKRAAQLAHDMNYRGVPVLYSWPSVGRTTSYIADTAVVRLSGRRLAEFLRSLRAQSGADVIHIVAHSMGNRALTDALELLAARWTGEGITEPQFGQIFFAAPDVDAGLFAEMASSIRPFAKRLTLYTSKKDWALVTSRKLHGNAPRAGQGGEVISQSTDFDTVDMSDLGEDMLAHSYFANDSSALVDIMALLWRNTEPSARCGVEPEQATGTNVAKNWIYRKGQCDVSRIMGLIATAWEQPRVDFPKIQKLIARYSNDPNEKQRLEQTFSSILGDE
ncbi:MAG: alpha/beta fold hydrolase, partial [Pseudomonadota bacterium]